MKPDSVLEFGCNSGRNLNQIQKRIPSARLTGIDVNPKAVEFGRDHFDLDLELSDEDWLERQNDDTFDVSLSVSVIDHMPYPEKVLRHLIRITTHYVVLFELAHDRLGKATHNTYQRNSEITAKAAYRYSYIHDYRHECERKLGAHCILDAKLPIGRDNLLDLYRLYVFSKRQEMTHNCVLQALEFASIMRD